MQAISLVGRFVVALLVGTSFLSAQQDDDCPPFVLSPVSYTPWLHQKHSHELPGTTVNVITGDAVAGGFEELYGLGKLLVEWTNVEGQSPQPVITWDGSVGLPQQDELTVLPDHPPFNQPPFSDGGKKPKEFDDPGDNPPHPVGCQCGVPEELRDISLKPLPPGVWPPAPMNYVQPTSWGGGHYGVLYHDGAGFFLRAKHTGGSPSESENTREIHFVDGTVNHYEMYEGRYSSGAAPRRHWRITHSIDPYDNLTRYHYEGGKLSKVERPDGMDEIYIYDPGWIDGTGAHVWPGYDANAPGVQYSGIEIRYELRGNPATAIPGKTRRYLYKKRSTVQHGEVTNPDFTAPLNGDLLYRIYYPSGQYLDALSDPTADEVFDLATASTKFEVAEFDYIPGTGLLKSVSHLLSDGITSGVETAATPVVTYTYASVGNRSRVHTETLHMLGLTYTYAYTLHPMQLGQSAIETTTRTSPDAATVIFTMDTRSRVTSVKTLPRTSGDGYADRAADPEYDPAYDSQPQTLETLYEYGGPWCTCKGKPTAVVEMPSNRRTEYDYEAITGLLREIRAPNPSGQPGFAITSFEWEPAVAGDIYGRWRIKKRTNAEGEVWEWSYPSETEKFRWDFAAHEVDLTGAHGTKSEWVIVNSPQVTGSTATPQQYSHASYFDTSNPPVAVDESHPSLSGAQGVLVGQLLQIDDTDGLVTEFSFDARGRLAGAELNPLGAADSVKTSYGRDDWGDLVSTTANATSTNPLTTVIVRDDRGAPTSISTVVDGLPHVERFYYDQWGNTAVVEATNQTSTGGAPDDFHPTSPRNETARPWLRDEWHYEGARLLVSLSDRRPLDQNDQGAISDSEDARFVRTDYVWSPDGWLIEVVGANEAETELKYDGFGSFFKATKMSGGGASVQISKYFVNDALEVTRSVDGLGNATVIERNGAGVVMSVVEPATDVSAVPNYPTGWEAPRARIEYDTDVMGRTSGVSVFEVGASTPVVSRANSFDEIGRLFSMTVTDPASAESHLTTSLWSGASTVEKITYPSGRFVERTYDALQRVAEVRDGMGNPNKSVYAYVPNTPFVASVTRWNWDEGGATPGYVKRPVEYVRDNLGRVVDMHVMPRDPAHPGDPTTALTHSFTYYTSGATESYTDPVGKVEQFLPDALGRLVERFLPGASPIWNGTQYIDRKSTSRRTEMLQMDGLSVPGNLAHTTKTIYDFAGRPVVVMDPGASVEPTLGNPHQSFARMMSYDAASRLTHLYASEDIEIQFHRDALGRLLQRDRVVPSPAEVNPGVVSFVWDRDNLERNVLGQLTQTNSYTLVDEEYVHETFATDVFGRRLRESFTYVDGFGGPNVISRYSGTDSFRSELGIENASVFDQLDVRFVPDAAGRVASMDWKEDGAAAWTDLVTYAHEGSAIRRRATTQALGGSSAFTFNTDYSYDAYGRMEEISQSFDPSALMRFEYDDASNLLREAYDSPDGAKGDAFEYDPHHRLHRAKIGADQLDAVGLPVGTFVKELTYKLDAAHNRTAVVDGDPVGGTSSTTTYSLQPGSNRYEVVGGSTKLIYDARGNLVFDGLRYYIYDALNRLTEILEARVVDPLASSQQSASTQGPQARFEVSDMSALRAARDLIAQRLAAVPDVVSRASDPDLRSVRSEPVSAGAITPLGSAAESGSGAQQVQLVVIGWNMYDAMNRRVTRWVGDDATYFFAWDGYEMVQQLAVRDGAPELTQVVFGEEFNEVVAYRRSSDVGVTWENFYIAEGGAHCPMRVLDEAGNVVEYQTYSPFGLPTFWDAAGNAYDSSQVGNLFAWRGGFYEPDTKSYYFINRHYDPELGRWRSRDPLGVAGDPVTRMNAYSYGSGAPLTQSDPLGLQIYARMNGMGEVVEHVYSPDPKLLPPGNYQFRTYGPPTKEQAEDYADRLENGVHIPVKSLDELELPKLANVKTGDRAEYEYGVGPPGGADPLASFAVEEAITRSAAAASRGVGAAIGRLFAVLSPSSMGSADRPCPKYADVYKCPGCSQKLWEHQRCNSMTCAQERIRAAMRDSIRKAHPKFFSENRAGLEAASIEFEEKKPGFDPKTGLYNPDGALEVAVSVPDLGIEESFSITVKYK